MYLEFLILDRTFLKICNVMKVFLIIDYDNNIIIIVIIIVIIIIIIIVKFVGNDLV